MFDWEKLTNELVGMVKASEKNLTNWLDLYLVAKAANDEHNETLHYIMIKSELERLKVLVQYQGAAESKGAIGVGGSLEDAVDGLVGSLADAALLLSILQRLESHGFDVGDLL